MCVCVFVRVNLDRKSVARPPGYYHTTTCAATEKLRSLRKAFGAAQAAIDSVRVCERRAPWSKVFDGVCVCVSVLGESGRVREDSFVAPVEELSLVFC